MAAFLYRLRLMGLLWALATVPMQAELSPDAYASLKAKASEVLVVNVTNVEEVTATTDGDNCTLYFTVDAVILNVNRTNIGYAPYDDVKFEAYARDRSIEECELFVGPSPPKLLEDGWCGLVYLNAPLGCPETLTPAAYGKSFQEYTTEQCDEAATSAPLVSYPTSGSSKGRCYASFAQLFAMIIAVETFLLA